MTAYGDSAAARLADAVREASATGTALAIRGAGSKRLLLGRRCEGRDLDVRDCRGIVSYRPEELVITARAGTPVSDLVAATAERGQRLPFEPLRSAGATLGGTVACGIAGPARPWRGGVRDAVLGARVINGRGELLRFGGEVMKNVAGYDVSRLQCGALGTLGVITEVSLRLLPLPSLTTTLRWHMDAAEALRQMREAAAAKLPLSGACWLDGELYLRFEGHGEAVAAVRRALPPGASTSERPPWQALREFRHALLERGPLWRVAVAPGTPLAGEAPDIIDWAGGQRFYRSDDAARMHALAAAGDGAASRYWSGDEEPECLAPPPPALRQLLERLKAAMDPERILNPGRLYAWL